jgi:multiple sugar transport system substrate-binding protein
MNKKITCLLTAALIAFGTAGCSKRSGNNDNITLTLSVVKEDNFLHEIIKKYEEDHPNINIELTDTSSQYNAQARSHFDTEAEIENYVKSVNTQIMSGKASDILTVNYLPYKQYADRSHLANMSEFMSSDKSFDSDRLYTNILDSFKYDGKLYGMPIKFYMPMIAANKSMLQANGINIDQNKWTWDNFVSIGETVVNNARKNGQNDTYVLAGMDEGMLIQNLVNSNYSRYVDKEKKTADFDSKEFIALLNLSKKMIDNKLVNTDLSGGKTAIAALINNLLFTSVSIQGILGLTSASIYDDGTTFMRKPSGQDDSGLSFYSNRIFGINNNSKHKNEAWDFIKYLVSDEAQNTGLLFGLPINKSAINVEIKRTQESISKGNVKGAIITKDGGTKKADQLTQEDIDAFNNMVSQINSYDNSDQGTEVIKIVKEETKAFFSGQKTAEEVAKLIQNRVTTYLRE